MLDFLEEYCMFEDHVVVWGDYKLDIHPTVNLGTSVVNRWTPNKQARLSSLSSEVKFVTGLEKVRIYSHNRVSLHEPLPESSLMS